LHDKTIRRRRAVLALLVVISLILLTDYFGESSSSPLHSVQRGIVEVLSPIQAGASKVLSPVRSAAHWVSSTFQAKSKLATVQNQYNDLKKVSGQDNYYHYENVQLRGLLKLDDSAQLSKYDPVGANIIGRDPQAWYDTIELDQGSGSGVAPRDPVVGPGGLIGDVTEVGASYSIVTLLTAPQFAVGAMVEGPHLGPDTDGDAGTLKPAIGNANTLVLSYLPTTAELGTGQIEVVTSGFQDLQKKSIESWAPPGIPIGTTPGGSAQQTGIVTNGQVNVTPSADLSNLSAVQILTTPHPSGS
jgi:rod shape-determining protein MreC